jgi:hypothetical protein
MRTRAALLLIASGLLLAGGAVAQPRNPYGGGTRIPEKSAASSYDFHQTRMVLQQFGQCLTKLKFRDARKYLLSVDDNETEKFRSRLLDDAGTCLDAGELQTVGMVFQGTLADAMLRQERLLTAPIDPRGISTLVQQSYLDLRANGATQQAIAQDVLSRFGECAVRADPAGAFDLLKSEPDSPGEQAAFSHLASTFPACVDKNHTITADKINLRAAIAYDYYRLAASASSATLSAEKH